MWLLIVITQINNNFLLCFFFCFLLLLFFSTNCFMCSYVLRYFPVKNVNSNVIISVLIANVLFPSAAFRCRIRFYNVRRVCRCRCRCRICTTMTQSINVLIKDLYDTPSSSTTTTLTTNNKVQILWLPTGENGWKKKKKAAVKKAVKLKKAHLPLHKLY